VESKPKMGICIKVSVYFVPEHQYTCVVQRHQILSQFMTINLHSFRRHSRYKIDTQCIKHPD